MFQHKATGVLKHSWNIHQGGIFGILDWLALCGFNCICESWTLLISGPELPSVWDTASLDWLFRRLIWRQWWQEWYVYHDADGDLDDKIYPEV